LLSSAAKQWTVKSSLVAVAAEERAEENADQKRQTDGAHGLFSDKFFHIFKQIFAALANVAVSLEAAASRVVPHLHAFGARIRPGFAALFLGVFPRVLAFGFGGLGRLAQLFPALAKMLLRFVDHLRPD